MTKKPPFEGSLKTTKRLAAFACSKVGFKVMDARQTRLNKQHFKRELEQGFHYFLFSQADGVQALSILNVLQMYPRLIN